MITRKIRNLLLLFLKNDIIVTSWGITEIKITELKISFHVCGFKYRGLVRIEAPTDRGEYLIRFGQNPPISSDLESVIGLLDEKIENNNIYFNELITRFIKD